MLRYTIICLSLSSPAMAEVCDRSTFALAEAEEGGPVQEPRINFTFESGVTVYPDGARETVYCVRNDESAPIWVKWHGPKPNLLFEDYTIGGGKQATRSSKSFEKTKSNDRKIEYGLSRNYGKETQGKTITFEASLQMEKPFLVQATPLDLVGQSFPEALANADALDRYLAAYRNSPLGGNELTIWSFATNWLPANKEVLARLAAGGEVEGYDGPYFQVSYGLRSVIDIDKQTATSSVLFWFGNFAENPEAFNLADTNGIRNSLSIVTAVGQFPGLADFTTSASYPVSEAGASLRRDVLEAKVGGGATLQIVPWIIGLAFNGIPLSAMQTELFEN